MFARDRREDGVPQGCCAARRPPQPLVPTRHRRHLHSTPTYLRATTPPARLDLTLLTARRYASSQTCAAIAQKICAGKCLSCGGMLHRTPIKPTHTVSNNRKIPADRYRVADQNSSASARRPDHPAANPIFYSSNRSTRARGSRPSWACWACLMRAPRPTCTSGPRRARPPAVYRQSSTIEPMLRCCLLASGMRFGGRAAEQYVASIIWLADPRASAGARGCRRRSGRLESCRLHDTRGHRHRCVGGRGSSFASPPCSRRCEQVGIQHGAGRGRLGGRSAAAGCGVGAVGDAVEHSARACTEHRSGGISL